MPTIEVPMRELSQVKRLRTDDEFIQKSKRLVKLCEEVKEKEEEIGELKPNVLETLQSVLRPDEKSIRVGDHRLTVITPEKGRKYLDTKKLLKFMTARQLEKCYSEGEAGQPYLQVAGVKAPAAMKDRATKKLRRGMDDGKGK